MTIFKKTLFLGGLAVLVTGCFKTETPQERHYRLSNTCLSYGFKEGTDEFAKCMQRESLHEIEMNQRSDEVWEKERANRELIDAIKNAGNNNSGTNNKSYKKSNTRYHHNHFGRNWYFHGM